MRKLIICLLYVGMSIKIFSPLSNTLVSTSEYLRVILVLDNSGSMKNNDPENLRFIGAQIMLGLLDPGDKFGLVLFSTQAKVLTDGLEVAGDTPLTNMAFLKELEMSKADGYTDIKVALQQAAGLLSPNSSKNEKIVIVLLTDGKPEIRNPYPAYEMETLDLAEGLDVPVMAIALTKSSQTPFLNELVLVTDGSLVYVENSSDLIGAFLQVLSEIKDRTVIGGERYLYFGNLEIEQTLVPYIESVTFIVAGSEAYPVQILNPDGIEVVGEDMDVPGLTQVTLGNPVGGMYSFRSQGMGEMQVWAILRSRLRAEVISPLHVFPTGAKMPIVVNLLEETTPGKFRKIIGEANFTAVITTPNGKQTSLDRFYDDGTHGDLIADDGNYTRLFSNTEQSGAYHIFIQGWKGSVTVGIEALTQAVQFPEIIVDAPMGSVEVLGNAIELKVHMENDRPATAPSIYAKVTSPSGDVQEIEMAHGDQYTGTFNPMEDGEYQIIFATRNAMYLGIDYLAEVLHSFQVAIVPYISVVVDKVDLPASCQSRPREVLASLIVNTNKDGILHLSNAEGWEIMPDEIRVAKGEQKIQIVLISGEELTTGGLSINLFMAGEGRTIIQPGNKLILNVEVPGIRERCRVPIRLGGGVLLFLLVGVTGLAKVRRAAMPLPVSGTLRHWEIGKSNISMEIDLTALHKNALMIGSASTCDVMISIAGLELEHALISTKKTVEGEDIYLKPVGEVHKGYSQQIAPFVMKHGQTFRMGTREFQYLSDRGE